MVLKSIRVTVETDTMVVIRKAQAMSAWCPVCGGESDAITLTAQSFAEPEAAAEMQRWLASGRLHVWQSQSGAVQVCVNSLLRCAQ